MPLTTSQKKRKVLEGFQGKAGRPNKKFRKQREYHSSSDEASDADEATDFKPVSLADSDDDADKVIPKKTTKKQARKPEPPKKTEKDDEEEQSESNVSSDADDDEDSDADSDGSLPTGSIGQRSVPKRNDPTAFSTSISKILATKLPTSARADPVLSRSKIATKTSTDLAEEKLDNQARAKLRAEKKEELDRGRVRDVLGIEVGQAGAVAEEEKRLRKIAQRGVVKLFNAVRAAQVRGEEAAKEERKKGTVGMGEREKAVNQVSKQGFLELINGKKGKPLNIEEA
ncbi:Rrp15p-domain-containing protein [Aspergillus granulosus]|uniref:Rrp15p-domain-containing protein n=1 Tax=Aspergillus granulosus TaxID=176169 RepID=A0ABR4H422_9EURO